MRGINEIQELWSVKQRGVDTVKEEKKKRIKERVEMGIGPPSRKNKLDAVLREHIGEWITASCLLSEIGNVWNLEGFGSARSLALFLKRYRLDKDDSEYYIEEEKINKVEAKPYAQESSE